MSSALKRYALEYNKEYVVQHTAESGTLFTHARLAVEWDAAAPDENTAYYLKRLDDCAQRFAPFFSPEDFARVFGPEDLFGFAPAGIRLHTTRRGTPLDHPAANALR